MSSDTTTPAASRPAAERPTPSRRRRRFPRHWTLAVTAVVVVILGEFVAGALGDRMQPVALFHSREVDVKVDQMRSLDSADVVFVGSSVVGAAVDPSVIAEPSGLVMYNASQSGASPALLKPWLDTAVLPELEPSVVVVGLTSNEFYAADGAELRDSYLGSRGYRMLTGDESVMDRANRWMTDHSNLFRYRGDLRKPKSLIGALAGTTESLDWVELLEDDGHLIPETVPAGFDKGGAPLPEWEIRDEAVTELTEMLDTISASGARVVLVAMPVIEPYIDLHGHGEADFAAYEQALRDYAADTGLPLLFYDDRNEDMFVDRVHMNTVGAETFSARLAADLDRLGVLDGEWVPTADGFGGPSAPSMTFSTDG